MLKRVISIVTLAGLIMSARTVLAEGLENFYLTPEVGYVLPTDGDVDDTIFLGGKLGYQFAPNWAGEIESGWMEYGIDFNDTHDNVDLQTVPVMFNLVYSDCAFGITQWYAYAGIGAAINDLDNNAAGAKADDSVAWQAGLGLELPFSENSTTAGILDARFFSNDPSIDGANGIDLSAVMFTAGIKF